MLLYLSRHRNIPLEDILITGQEVTLHEEHCSSKAPPQNKYPFPNEHAYVAVPTIQAISYSMDSEKLRDLYANLLSKAMNSDTKDFVHPAYIETIKQLSPDDASYFKYICPLRYRPMIDVILDLPNAITKTIAENANLFSTGHVENFGLTLDNLSRLGLITIPHGIWYGDDYPYEQLLSILKTEYTIEKYLPFQPDAIGISYNKKRIDITSYGNSFYSTCCI